MRFLLAALLLGGCVERIPDPGGDWLIKAGYAHSPPPVRFQGDYAGELTIHRVADVAAKCAEFGPFVDDIVGCAIAGAGFCIVVIPESTVTIIADGRPFRMTPNAVLAHEMGHCNGWGSDHED